MAKRKKKKNTDKETLEHYTSYEEKDVPAGIPKPADDAKENNPPEYVKADISVDEVMSRRKNAVITNPPPPKESDT